MVGGKEILAIVIAWSFQISFFGAILFAAYRVNSLHRRVEELRDDLKVIRDRVEGMPPVQ